MSFDTSGRLRRHVVLAAGVCLFLVAAAPAVAAHRPGPTGKPACSKAKRCRALADVLVNTSFALDVPLPPTVVNPCDGEVVELHGNIHILFSFTESTDGTVNWHVQTNYQNVSGVALGTLTKYQASNTTMDDYHSGSDDWTSRQDQELISQGSPPNFILHVLVHFSGPTAFVERVDPECRG